QAHRLVAAQIKTLLRPGGKVPRGHLHVHCGGGMHRTSMFVGVIERCINASSVSDVIERYRQHVGWTDATHPGGFEAQNVDFIESFPCELLTAAP
ncbi:MAG TPA: hypothetical protein DCQ06_03870, partial [Myxococcales bacterium]|nr:hypothetical protein [Myxococcales bacterium]